MSNATKIGLSILIGGILGALIASFWANGVYRGQLDRFDTELRDYQSRVVDFELENRGLKETNSQLRDTIAGLSDTISAAQGTARGIATTLDSLSGQSGSAQEKLRRVIVALTEIRDRIRDLENMGDHPRN
mgnify:CR=1 FL=1